jgi:hypothetical protein
MKHMLVPRSRVIERLAAVTVLLGFLSYAYSFVEGSVNPVMGDLEITDVRDDDRDEFGVVFDGTASKFRDCTWVESRWYIGTRSGSNVRTLWSYSGKPRLRDVGDLQWTDMTARMTQWELMNNSFADVVHDCNWSPWPVVTPFYTAVPPS